MRMRMKNRWGIVLGMAMGIAVGQPARADSGILHCMAVPTSAPGTAVTDAAPRFVMRRVVRDDILHRNWAVFQDCAHPERPPEMVQIVTPSSLQNMQTAARSRTGKIAASSTQTVLPVMTRIAKNQVQARLKPVLPPPFKHQAISSTPLSSIASSTPKPLLVRAGDRVRLWSASANVRLEVEAVALEYGRAGQVIHLRRLNSGIAGQRIILTGVVDGAGSAELLP